MPPAGVIERCGDADRLVESPALVGVQPEIELAIDLVVHRLDTCDVLAPVASGLRLENVVASLPDLGGLRP